MQSSIHNMLTDNPNPLPEVVDKPSHRVWRRFLKHRLAVFGSGILILMVLMAVFAPWLTPYNPNATNLTQTLSPPSAQHILGTDGVGRDVLSRLIAGSRVSLSVGFLAGFLTTIIGVVFGAVSGYYGKWVDNIMMRIVDFFLSIPTLFLLILASAILVNPSIYALMAIIGFTSWPSLARLIRGQVLQAKNFQYVEAAKALGAPGRRILWRHIVPGLTGIIVVSATLSVGGAIYALSALSFLGLGVQPPTADWGSMLSDASTYVFSNPLLAVWPGLMIFLAIMAFNFLGDGLRDAFDAKRS